MGRIRPRLTYANVLSTLCLFIVLGGTAWAVAANSVGTAQLKDRAVTTPKIKNGAVAAAKLAPLGAVTPVKPGQRPSKDCSAQRTGQFCRLWANFGQGYAGGGFYKDRSGLVHLRGSVESSANGGSLVVFYLPPGYRPTGGARNFVVESDEQIPSTATSRRFDNVTIRGDGSVQANNRAAYLSLDGISFRP